ncbi:hypothetical protein IFM89_003426 [Coptis chinensis]|uniref:Transposase n=1 Tax=Coptis chinensis TaxID=261450 RepID=A0A835GX37_9MAGN|nr:hypothetical protein IFM89_003426 [Coptis chinensis]
MAPGQSQPISSQPSSSVPFPSHNSTPDSHTSQHSGNSPTITKLPIEFDEDGVAMGPNHTKWNTQVGSYVRSRIPIHYKDWRKIDGSFKDNVWNKLMEEFEPNVPQATTHQEVEKDFPQKFRSTKYALRKEILRKCGSVEEAIAACSDGKDPNHWVAFVRNESTTEVRARNTKNVENAKKNIYRHTNGWDTYAHKLDKMDKEDPSRKHGWVDSWKKRHERRDGTILASARTHYEQVEASHKIRKEASAGGIAKALLQQASSSSNFELKGEMNEMKSSLANVMGVLKDVLKAVKNNGTSTAQPPCGTTTLETEIESEKEEMDLSIEFFLAFLNLFFFDGLLKKIT